MGYSREEWDRMPWHDQRMYYEGLCELLDMAPTYAVDGDRTSSVSINEAEGPVTPFKPSAPVVHREPEGSAMTGTDGDHVPLGRYGIQIQRTTFG